MKLKLSLEVLGLLALAAVIAVMPRLVSSFTAYEMATVGMYFIALLGLSILTGYSGQISLGHGAFMAIGGYTTAVLSVNGVFSRLSTLPLVPPRKWSNFNGIWRNDTAMPNVINAR